MEVMLEWDDFLVYLCIFCFNPLAYRTPSLASPKVWSQRSSLKSIWCIHKILIPLEAEFHHSLSVNIENVRSINLWQYARGLIAPLFTLLHLYLTLFLVFLACLLHLFSSRPRIHFYNVRQLVTYSCLPCTTPILPQCYFFLLHSCFSDGLFFNYFKH